MKCKIITTVKQTEESAGYTLFDDDAVLSETDGYDASVESADIITTYFEGDFIVDGDDVRISYDESQEAMGSVHTVVSFKLSAPSEVLLSREGEVESLMLFSQSERTISVYETPFMPFEVAIYARRVDNRIMTEGVLNISYIIEIKGALAQRTELKMEVKR